MLREMGAQVRLAESAGEAMAVFGAFRPSVLLCDIAMPGPGLVRKSFRVDGGMAVE